MLYNCMMCTLCEFWVFLNGNQGFRFSGVTTLMGKWFLTFWRMFGLLGLKVHGPWSFGDEGDLHFQNIRNQLSSDTVTFQNTGILTYIVVLVGCKASLFPKKSEVPLMIRKESNTVSWRKNHTALDITLEWAGKIIHMKV
jgi:hypothetical protein